MVNTRKVKRRELNFASLDEWAAGVERVRAAGAGGRLRALGNWSAARIVVHLTKWVEYSIGGFPFRYPASVRWPGKVIKLFSWKLLYRIALSPGFKNPPAAAASVEPDTPVTLEAACDLCRRQIARVDAGERMTADSPAGWSMTHEMWLWVHLRHAEMHMGFIEVTDAP